MKDRNKEVESQLMHERKKLRKKSIMIKRDKAL